MVCSRAILFVLLLTAFLVTLPMVSGVSYYWNFNEDTGTTATDSAASLDFSGNMGWNSTGKYSASVQFNGDGEQRFMNHSDQDFAAVFGEDNWTLEFWLFPNNIADIQAIMSTGEALGGVTKGGVSIGFIAGGLNIFADNDTSTYIRIDQRTGISTNTWQHIAYVKNGTALALYIDGAYTNSSGLTSGLNSSYDTFGGQARGLVSTNYFEGQIDEIKVWETARTAAEVIIDMNEGIGLTPLEIAVTLISPTDNSKESGTIVSFISNGTVSNGNLTNATLYIWNSTGEFNITFNSVVGNTTNTTQVNVTNFALGQTYAWNVYWCVANATASTCAFAISNYTMSSSSFSETANYYYPRVFETSLQRFSQVIAGNPSISSASAVLVYNNTRYISTVTDGVSGIYRANNSLDIPLVSSTTNNSFWWEWTFLINAVTLTQNSSFFNQTVNRTYLELCKIGYTTPFINFSSKSAENPFPTLNATFKSAWNWWLGSGSVKRNQSYEDITETNNTFNFCGNPTNQTLKVNADIEYDATGYAQNYYYLTNASLSNNTNYVSLYLLNDSLATLAVLKVYDTAQNPLEDVYFQIQLYDIGTDTFYTVGMAKSSFNGEDIVYLNWYDSFYKIILTRYGQVIETVEPYKISETPQIFEIVSETTFSFDKFRDFIYSLTYNPTTENFVLTFTKPSGLVDQGCLRVTKRTATNDTEVCLICETSSSATVYCNINAYGNGTYIASFYATGSWYLVDTISERIGIFSLADTIRDKIGNVDGTAYAILGGLLITFMFFVSPVLGVIGVILGIFGAMVLGFTPIYYLEFIGIVIIGGVIIWLLKS